MFVVTLNIRAEDQVELHLLQSNMHFLFLMTQKRVHRYALLSCCKLIFSAAFHSKVKVQVTGRNMEHKHTEVRGQSWRKASPATNDINLIGASS